MLEFRHQSAWCQAWVKLGKARDGQRTRAACGNALSKRSFSGRGIQRRDRYLSYSMLYQ
ncbi:hypothetical protein [Phormidium sp. CCY1219]|uniref:hypothetical protein n=1 Tax=Phormidium sp. CCY1219 TaxID=2886104 RepID=UPI002D1E9228|nr:hypothetical protein [Phormidium sp. CCY1219]MEB3829502.1 hypothetical protein [Phormidium sp. CCY1219]